MKAQVGTFNKEKSEGLLRALGTLKLQEGLLTALKSRVWKLDISYNLIMVLEEVLHHWTQIIKSNNNIF